ncbi:unnamed protein product, partial [Polarella glacialis]
AAARLRAAPPGRSPTDWGGVLKRLHWESARNLERLMKHVNEPQSAFPKPVNKFCVGAAPAPMPHSPQGGQWGFGGCGYGEVSPALSSQATALLPEDWAAVTQHDMPIPDSLKVSPRSASGASSHRQWNGHWHPEAPDLPLRGGSSSSAQVACGHLPPRPALSQASESE